jgi:hypothetical protein
MYGREGEREGGREGGREGRVGTKLTKCPQCLFIVLCR